MKITELIGAVGDENIMVQNLEQCFTESKFNGKKNATFITFGTEETFGTTKSKVGLVLWMPRDLVKKAREQFATK